MIDCIETELSNYSKSFYQLTNETVIQTVEDLSTLVQETESRPVEQSTENLGNIADVLVNVATFVNESDIVINETVSFYLSCMDMFVKHCTT